MLAAGWLTMFLRERVNQSKAKAGIRTERQSGQDEMLRIMWTDWKRGGETTVDLAGKVRIEERLNMKTCEREGQPAAQMEDISSSNETVCTHTSTGTCETVSLLEKRHKRAHLVHFEMEFWCDAATLNATVLQLLSLSLTRTKTTS